MSRPLIEVKNLKKHFKTKKGIVHAVDGISFSIDRQKTLGVVGESGCGKSTAGRTILRLLEPTDGEVLINGKDVSKFDRRQLQEFRKEAQIVFQDPFSSLNPRKRVFDLIQDPLAIHRIYKNKNDKKKRVLELMDVVGLSHRLINTYPHELDGGRRQRIGIAKALALNPELIVLDEPVSALDVSVQARILNLLGELQKEMELTYLFISHDLSVVRHVSDEIAVMYLGKIVEKTDYKTLFNNPLHPYSQALISAIPVPDLEVRKRIILEGDVPSPINLKGGCRFYGRCWKKTDLCLQVEPELEELKKGVLVACHHAEAN
ncbi:oligopeptide/dipeptide ABC transporter, ATPase subunit [Alkaliphilus metalliredigens QYMF]|uniref:Oligopeptide/dipeptide ABC transporter, ATPase subunit n=1 Tax=Alkaliphilus metalliredigens (strain QYMF) TaxID=293826 RepID=A6TPC7_ALKMQ|nr:oligopeptide/dipeptide ABC transporter ATP-binding protein [Alkaliphilus metalliredigens]ABR48045.1 oligopeptide/dipeptide ABC transporter, ATPase subunit [Alkaliphilus metalliredigens QYMF]